VTTVELMQATRPADRWFSSTLSLQARADHQGRHFVALCGRLREFSRWRSEPADRCKWTVCCRRRAEAPLVFFCEGVKCWETYNAALRARAAVPGWAGRMEGGGLSDAKQPI